MFYKQQKCISHSSGGWEVKDHSTGRFCVGVGENLLPGHKWVPHALTWLKGLGISVGIFYRHINLIPEDSTPMS